MLATYRAVRAKFHWLYYMGMRTDDMSYTLLQ